MTEADVPSIDPEAELWVIEDDVLGLSNGALFSLQSVDRSGLVETLRRVDGRRTVAEIAAELSKEFDAADVVALLQQLDGLVVKRSDPAPSADLAAASVLVLGGGLLAAAAVRELDRLGIGALTARSELTFASCATEAFRARCARARLLEAPAHELDHPSGKSLAVDDLAALFAGRNLVVCALEGARGQALLDVDEAARRAQAPVLFVTMEGGNCVVGPLVVPARSPCFACSRLTTSLKSHFDRIGPQLVPVLWFGALAPQGPTFRAERAAFEVAREAERLLTGRGYPACFGQLLVVRPDGEQVWEPFEAATTCPACRGHHRAALLDPSGPPPTRELDRRPTRVIDETGGARTVTPEQAELRARRALDRLGVQLECVPLPGDAPEDLLAFECPFFRAETTATYSPGAPMVFASFSGSCFGKGTTEAQARCSAIFEWFERHLSHWRGEQDLVRASYDQVRGRAIDMGYHVSGLLPGLQLEGKRPFDPTAPVDWLWAHCLRSDRAKLVPAASVFLSGTRFLGSDFELPSQGSSGLSAGCSVGDALLQGLLEIIERDASHVALRTGVARCSIDLASVEDPAVNGLQRRIRAAGYDAHVRDITTSVGIPTFEVYLVKPGEYLNHFAPGHGAHLDPAIALRRALTEAAQSLFYGASMGLDDVMSSPSSYFSVFPHRLQAIAREGAARPMDRRRPPEADGTPWEQIEHVVSLVSTAIPGADVCFVDLSHPALDGIHVVRAMITGMLDEVRPAQVHVPERARLVPLDQMFLGTLAL